MKKKRLMRRSGRMRSKRGLSLIELVVGVTIMVIVFGGTMSAMANGYTDTLYNASENADAAKCATINEVVMTTLQEKQFANINEFNEYFGTHSVNIADSNNAFYAAANASVGGGVRYCSTISGEHQFPDSAFSMQFGIFPNAYSFVDGKQIKGMEIKSAVKTVKGWVINKSFVPYADQE